MHCMTGYKRTYRGGVTRICDDVIVRSSSAIDIALACHVTT